MEPARRAAESVRDSGANGAANRRAALRKAQATAAKAGAATVLARRAAQSVSDKADNNAANQRAASLKAQAAVEVVAAQARQSAKDRAAHAKAAEVRRRREADVAARERADWVAVFAASAAPPIRNTA